MHLLNKSMILTAMSRCFLLEYHRLPRDIKITINIAVRNHDEMKRSCPETPQRLRRSAPCMHELKGWKTLNLDKKKKKNNPSSPFLHEGCRAVQNHPRKRALQQKTIPLEVWRFSDRDGGMEEDRMLTHPTGFTQKSVQFWGHDEWSFWTSIIPL